MQYTQQAIALSASQLQVMQEGIHYFNVDDCTISSDISTLISGAGTPDGTTFPNLDPDDMANAINTFIQQENPNSALAGLGSTIVADGQHSNINPFVIVAVARQESNLADPSYYNVSHGNNSFGRTAAPGQPSFEGAKTWYKWTSVKNSVDYTAPENQGAQGGGDEATYLANQYSDAIKSGDVSNLVKAYDPNPSEQATYIPDVTNWIQKMANLTQNQNVSGQAGADTTNAPTESNSAVDSTSGSVDISDTVSKYKLQSVMIQQVGGSEVASYNPQQPPTTPASTMKLIIADTALRSGLDPNKKVSVTPDIYYDGGNDLNMHGNSTISLGDAMDQMLNISSNVGANVLMKAMGGVSAFTSKAQGYGYTDTTVRGYYDPANDGKNTSTIGDEVNAMNHIFSTGGTDYKRAQNDLKSADNHYNVAGDVANKWAGTSDVAGNVGLFNINGNQYIIGLYYNGNIGTENGNTIQRASADLLSDVQNSGSSSTTPTSGGCCPSGSGESVVGSSVSGSISPGVGKGMSASAQQKFQQYLVAAGQKFNVDPDFIATFYYTEMGRTGDSSGNNSDAATGTPVAGDGNWIEPAPPVGNGAPYVKNNVGYWPPYGLGDGSDNSFNTMAAYGKDGDGDGNIEPNDLADAVFTAANLLASDGAKQGADDTKLKAVAYLYNHSDVYAQSVMNTYNYLKKGGSTPVTGGGGSGASCMGGGTSPDCQTVTGTAKILCAAKAYKGIYYHWGGGHPDYSAFKSGCPDPSNPPNNHPHGAPIDVNGQSGNPSPCALDCSGLVSVAVDDAFGQDYMWSVHSEMQGTGAQYWHSIPMSQAQAGDIVTTPEHVEIVDHVSGGTVYTFGAHDTGETISPTSASTSYYTGGAWRWTGPTN